MQVKRLQSGFLDTMDPQMSKRGDGWLERPVLMIYDGEFESMDGPVTVTQEHVRKMVDSMNSMRARFLRFTGLDATPLRFCPPMQLDHNLSATLTVGRVVGPAWLGELELEDGSKRLGGFAWARVLGEENCEKVEDGRWIHVSIGGDLDAGKLNELSFVPFPAVKHAAMLSRFKSDPPAHEPADDPKGDTPESGDPTLSTTPEGEAMSYKQAKALMEKYEKCRKKLASSHPDEDDEKREERLASLSEDDVERLSKEHDDEEAARLAAEPEDENKEKLSSEEPSDEEKEKKETQAKRLAALTEAQTRLSGALASIRLAEKKASIGVRLSRLRASGKITPAEIKKMDLDGMAGKSDDVVNAVLESYEQRQPVIDPRVYGSINADNAAEIVRRVQFAKKEKEVFGRMAARNPTMKKAAESRLSETSDEEEIAENIRTQVDERQALSETEMGELQIIHRCLEEGKSDEAKMKLGEYLARVKTRLESGTPADDGQEHHLAALAAARKEVETLFSEAVEAAKGLQV